MIALFIDHSGWDAGKTFKTNFTYKRRNLNSSMEVPFKHLSPISFPTLVFRLLAVSRFIGAKVKLQARFQIIGFLWRGVDCFAEASV